MSKCIEWLFHILQVLVSPPTSPPPLFQAVVTVCFSRAHSRPKRAPHSLSFVYMLCSHNVKHLKSSLLHTPATIRRRALFHLRKKTTKTSKVLSQDLRSSVLLLGLADGPTKATIFEQPFRVRRCQHISIHHTHIQT